MARPTNCKNCGAVLHWKNHFDMSKARCEYCDTEYISDGEGLYINVKRYEIPTIDLLASCRYSLELLGMPNIEEHFKNELGKMIGRKIIEQRLYESWDEHFPWDNTGEIRAKVTVGVPRR